MRHIKHLYKDKKFIKNFSLIVLVLVTICLGSLVYKKYHVPVKQDAVVNAPVLNNVGLADFSEDQQKLLHPPAQGAPQSEIDEHAKLAAKLAVIDNAVEIKDCKSDPLVLQSKLKSAITFKNSGSYDISVSFDQDNVFNIKPGKSVDISKAFIHGIGLYGYICEGDGFRGLVGFTLITP